MHERAITATPRIRLRQQEFEHAVVAMGWTGNTQIAKGLQVDRTTVSRIRRSLIAPGEQFIAAALMVLDVPFEALFEIEITQEVPGERHARHAS